MTMGTFTCLDLLSDGFQAIMPSKVKNLASDRNKSFVRERLMDLVRLKKFSGVTQWGHTQALERPSVDTCFKTSWCWKEAPIWGVGGQLVIINSNTLRLLKMSTLWTSQGNNLYGGAGQWGRIMNMGRACSMGQGP